MYAKIGDIDILILTIIIYSIRILNQFNEIVNITGTRLPSLAVDGNTGEYTCEVCSNREAAEELCVTSTIPVLGRRTYYKYYIVKSFIPFILPSTCRLSTRH